MLVLDQQTTEALARLGNDPGWVRFIALLESTYMREIDNLLGARDTNRVLHQQGYVQAVKDVLQTARSAKPSLPRLG